MVFFVWALEYGIHSSQPTRPDMADFLHEVMTGAQQDGSRVRTSSVAAAIQSLKFVSREAQIEPLLEILERPLGPGGKRCRWL